MQAVLVLPLLTWPHLQNRGQCATRCSRDGSPTLSSRPSAPTVTSEQAPSRSRLALSKGSTHLPTT
eukprot:scaffold567_cov384-Prasinococcus_capsulatus_cf.AAC.11